MSRQGFEALDAAMRQARADARSGLEGVTDINGQVVGTGVWPTFDGQDPSVGVAVMDEIDEYPRTVLVLTPPMARALARELLAAAKEAQS